MFIDILRCLKICRWTYEFSQLIEMSLICPICQENLINGESPENYVNKCGHVYHSNCILPWWDRAPEQNCPQCREPCNIDTITKLYLTVDHTLDNCEGAKKTAITIDDPKTEILVRQIKEHIDVQTYNQTKELNEKFRQQNSEFSTLLLNNITRLRSNYDDKLSAVSKELSTGTNLFFSKIKAFGMCPRTGYFLYPFNVSFNQKKKSSPSS